MPYDISPPLAVKKLSDDYRQDKLTPSTHLKAGDSLTLRVLAFARPLRG